MERSGTRSFGRLSTLGALAALLTLAVQARADTPAPSAPDDTLAARVTAMARIGGAYSPVFSSDGSRLAFLTNISGSPQVWVMPAAGGYPQQVTALDDPVGALDWSPTSDRLAYSVAPGGGLNTQIYLAAPDGSDVRRVTPGGEVNSFFDGFMHDGRLAFGTNERDPAGSDVFLLDPADGHSRLVAKLNGLGGILDVSRDGRHALIQRLIKRGDDNLYLVDLSSGKETLLTPHRGPGSFAGAFAADGTALYVASNSERDRLAFGRIDLTRGKPGRIEILAARSDAELDELRLDRQGRRAALVWNVGGRNEIEWYDLATGKRSAAPPLPADVVNSLVFSPDGASVALALVGSARPSDVWRFDFASNEYRQLSFSPHAGIDLARMVRPELRRFKSFDGLELSGWLYLPKDYRAPGPIVLSFHGGPEGQERPVFRSDYQALLARGIAVFAPNIRGSSGFGKRYVNLDNGARRFDANRDIKAAADYVVAAGVADKKRIGIMGGSYGGYAVMIGMTDYPDTFAAGADLFGIVNFKTFFSHTQPWMAAISTVEYGDPKTQGTLLDKLSPLGRIDRITSPLLVLHGANDTNVPVIEAEQIVANLKARDVPVEYVLFPDEGHGWRRTPNRIRSTLTIVRFFERQLKAE